MFNKGSLIFSTLTLALISFIPASASADGALTIPRDSSPVVRKGEIEVTQSDVDAYLNRMPEEHQGAFLMDSQRLGQAIEQLLLVRILGKQAIDAQLLDEPLVQGHLYQLAMVYLADERRKRHLAERTLDDYGQQARELYLTQPSLFEVPAEISFSHILVNRGRGRGELEAMERIQEVYARLEGGEEFESLALEYSDDPYVEENRGHYRNVALEELEGEVADALKMMQAGQISEPVLSGHGWHIIRLDERADARKLSWEEAEERAREIAEHRHRQDIVDALYRDALNQHPLQIEPGAVEELLQRHGIKDPERPTGESIQQHTQG